MESKTDILEIVGNVREYAEKMCRRRQELQEDEVLLNGIINRLNLHSCSVKCDRSPTKWPGKEEIMQAYQKALEDRDEYKFQLNDCKNKIKELKKELDIARETQTQLNTSAVPDVAHVNERGSCAFAVRWKSGDCSHRKDKSAVFNTIPSVSEEAMKRELNYLHKTNEELFEENRNLKSKLKSQEDVLEKLKMREEEISKLKTHVAEKQAKMMEMQIKFDEQLRNLKYDFNFQISTLNKKILDLEGVRDTYKIDLDTALEELRLLRIKMPVKDVAHNNTIQFPDQADPNPKETDQETLRGKEELFNVNSRREKRNKLQSIENIMEHEHPTFTSTIEQSHPVEQQVTVDEVKDLSNASRGAKRGQKGGKGSKKEPSGPMKKGAKKMKTSDEKCKDPLCDEINELKDASSSYIRKDTRTRRKAPVRSEEAAVTNKRNKKCVGILEKDENTEPSPLECSRFSLNGTLGKMELAENSSTPVIKPLKKVEDANKKRTNRRRNK